MTRFRYDPDLGRCVEIGADWSDAERRAPVPTEQLVYGGLGRATDGTPIDSRTKHRDYMKATGTALASDFKETWARAEKKREEFRRGESREHQQSAKEAIGRAMQQTRRK